MTTTESVSTTTTTDRPVVIEAINPQIPPPPPNQPAPERTVPDDLSQSSPCAVITGPMAKGQYTVSSPFGQRGGEFHRGIDLAASEGTPIYAALDGKVVAAGPATGFGNWIVIDSTTSTGQVSTVYGHMYDSGLHVHTGDVVKAGQHIADVGSNGQSSGAHLHFELWQGLRLGSGKAVDPAPMLEQAAPAASQSALKIAHAIADCAVRPGAGLAPGKVPQEFVPWLLKGAAECPNSGITAPLLAAQLEAENNFHYGASAPVSSTGARGPAQFMPATWETWKVDADNNGVADINSIADAVVAQAHFMCRNWQDTAAGVNSGALHGDAVDLALAAYNAGFGAVQAAGGMPSGGDYTTQTRPYVRTIRELERQFASTDFNSMATAEQQTDRVAKAAQAAKQYLGTAYAWGGGNTKGPTHGGFDAPGLASCVTYVATSGGTTLPRTVQQQWAQGHEIAVDQAKAGDLVFSDWNSDGTPRHVGIAIGGGRMVHASSTDGTVVEAPIGADAKVRSVS
ncbi:peptidoglycan DD-metalloendopeptidase family protein [Nocardia sp. CA-119907]|uniref:peptidoglycan DD-metalloendopeptidase family protein n=1 Tax=Nocardia sp. CA-119907 TaxID=3239973 RepID=UPI003D96C87D